MATFAKPKRYLQLKDYGILKNKNTIKFRIPS